MPRKSQSHIDYTEYISDIPYLNEFVSKTIAYIAMLPESPEIVLGKYLKTRRDDMIHIEFENTSLGFYENNMFDTETWVHEFTEFSMAILTEKEVAIHSLARMLTEILHKEDMSIDELKSMGESDMKDMVDNVFSSKYVFYYNGIEYESTLRHTITSLVTRTHMGNDSVILTGDEFWDVLTNQERHKHIEYKKCYCSDDIYHMACKPIMDISYKCEHSYDMKKKIPT